MGGGHSFLVDYPRDVSYSDSSVSSLDENGVYPDTVHKACGVLFLT